MSLREQKELFSNDFLYKFLPGQVQHEGYLAGTVFTGQIDVLLTFAQQSGQDG